MQELMKTRDVEIARLGARDGAAPDLDVAALQFRAEAHEGIIIQMHQQVGPGVIFMPIIGNTSDLPYAGDRHHMSGLLCDCMFVGCYGGASSLRPCNPFVLWSVHLGFGASSGSAFLQAQQL